MGKSVKPLTIVALPPCDEWDELKKLEAQGHKVYRINHDGTFHGLTREELLEADLVIGDRCWRMTTAHARYLPSAIKEARMLRYPKKEERADVKKRANVGDGLDIGGVLDTSEATESD